MQGRGINDNLLLVKDLNIHSGEEGRSPLCLLGLNLLGIGSGLVMGFLVFAPMVYECLSGLTQVLEGLDGLNK